MEVLIMDKDVGKNYECRVLNLNTGEIKDIKIPDFMCFGEGDHMMSLEDIKEALLSMAEGITEWKGCPVVVYLDGSEIAASGPEEPVGDKVRFFNTKTGENIWIIIGNFDFSREALLQKPSIILRGLQRVFKEIVKHSPGWEEALDEDIKVIMAGHTMEESIGEHEKLEKLEKS